MAAVAPMATPLNDKIRNRGMGAQKSGTVTFRPKFLPSSLFYLQKQNLSRQSIYHVGKSKKKQKTFIGLLCFSQSGMEVSLPPPPNSRDVP